eukprot:TRINITY_DN33424_c0_g1_i1.p1 TRINITY_DN33424_c0_g1~~TRINITY_DN33424_c0_g1_i1.p1  ORF type:complete len:474 (+),score=103.67 TRINITY_DN33424_c0_g1_i1:52-1422(+)
MTGVYEPMPKEQVEKAVNTMESLFKDMVKARAEGDDGVNGDEYVGGDVPDAVTCDWVRVPLEAPMMSAEEVKSISVKFSDVAEDGGESLRAVLDEHGVAIVQDCVNAAELRVFEELWKADLLTLAGPVKTSRQPMVVKNAYKKIAEKGVTHWPIATHLGTKFANVGGLTSGGYAWASRLHPNVKTVFQNIHQDEDLVVGMDNVFFTPKAKPPLRNNEYWLHADQNTHESHPSGETVKCYQGVLYTWPSTSPEASTTVVCLGSHKDPFDLLMTDVRCATQGHYVAHLSVSNPDIKKKMLEMGHAKARRVPVPAGGLLLWDSRVSHQGWEGGKRLAMPVCWEPARIRPEDARRRKLWMAATGVPSTHWASLGIVHSLGPKSLVTQPTPGSDTECSSSVVILPLYPSIIPFAIAPEKIQQWKEAIPSLWSKGGSKACAGSFNKAGVVEELLRPEVLAVL